MSVPEWVQDAIFYQIFPDRFANGNTENDPPNIVRWGTPPTPWGFQGGDLLGIQKRFDYLLDLGITAIYLNPIFQSTSTHRYNTTDYFKIDNKLGNLQDFQNLCELAHRNGVRVILDGVFNHCGRGFFAFNDVLENQEYSPYRNWFQIKRFPVDAYSWGEAADYLGWWGMKSLPKLNTSNPPTRKYLLDVARYWIEKGADGWRLDVPNEINDDNFWAEFRQVVKTANPQAYIVGEIWNPDLRWVGEGHCDGLMDYPVLDALVGLLSSRSLDVGHFAEKVEGLLSFYPRENAYAMYVPLGTHDTERILTRMGNDLLKTRLAYLFQFSYPGAPAIYYGDEIGLVGGKDPACRGAFLWEQNSWNHELRKYIKNLVALRKQHSALRRGDYLRLTTESKQACYAFARLTAQDQVLVVMNPNETGTDVNINVEKLAWQDGYVAYNLLKPGKEFTVFNRSIKVQLPAWGGLWLG
jgi:cyclomaltodextrinase